MAGGVVPSAQPEELALCLIAGSGVWSSWGKLRHMVLLGGRFIRRLVSTVGALTDRWTVAGCGL